MRKRAGSVAYKAEHVDGGTLRELRISFDDPLFARAEFQPEPNKEEERMSDVVTECPFCGGKPAVQIDANFLEQVRCSLCGAHTLWSEDAREQWNKRMSKRLKKCPICGQRGRVHATYNGKYCVQCENCGLTSGCYKTEAEVIAAWNRRVNND